ncbi:MAG: hypothetical protein QM725_13850 [Lacibacter sp.]
MKNFLLLLSVLVVSSSCFSQVVTGVYRGQMQSDSLKTSVDFELTLKEKNGKLYGYCHRLFIVNDVLFYNLVKVTGRIKDSVLIVEDEKSVSNNFEESTKGIKTVFFFNLRKLNDTAMVLTGEWSTSTWRNNRAIAGQLAVNRETNYLATQLYKRLEEKKLATEMAFEEPVKQQPAIALNKVSNPVKENSKQPDPATNQPNQTIPAAPVANIPALENTDSSQVILTKTSNQAKESNKQPDVATSQPKQTVPAAPPAIEPVSEIKDSPQVVITKKTAQVKESNKQPDVALNQPKQQLPAAPAPNKPAGEIKDSSTTVIIKTEKEPGKQPGVVITQPKENAASKPSLQKKDSVQTTTGNITGKPVAQINKPQIKTANPPASTNAGNNSTSQTVQQNKPATNQPKPGPVTVQKPVPVINNPVIVKREMEIIQTVDIAQDSIVLSLYDNGEIDGDTVSVFVNNELSVSKVGLSAKAYKKTLYFKPGESLQLTLFAENLGSIPPNTGLLVIYTDTDRYQINFTSTFSKSSSVVLRRKQ